MAAKRFWLIAVVLALGMSSGCCKMWDHFCGNPCTPPAGANCACVPACQPAPPCACPPGTTPVPAVPASGWQRPAYSGPNGCCP